MARIVSISNQKGGVAKTTSAINIAHALAKAGKRVLAIDADPQASLSILAGLNPTEQDARSQTLYHGIVENRPIIDLVTEGNPAFVASSIRLARIEQELMASANYSFKLLRECLVPLREEYDVILIDCQPHLGILTANALFAATSVLIPVKTDYLSFEGVPLVLEEIDNIRRRGNTGLKVLGLLPTLFNEKYRTDRIILDGLRTIAKSQMIHLFDPITRRTQYDRDAASGSITMVDSPNTPGVDVFHDVARRLVSHG